MFQDNLKKFFPLSKPLTQFSFLTTLFTIYSIICLTDFEKTNWWIYSENRLFYYSLFNYVVILTSFFVYIFLNKSILNDKSFSAPWLLITLNCVFLIVFPTVSIWFYFAIFLLSIFFNKFLRFKGFPVFNPAAIGIFFIFVCSFLMNRFGIEGSIVFISWWGTSIYKGGFDISIFKLFIGSAFLVWVLIYLSKMNRIIFSLAIPAVFCISFFIYTYSLIIDPQVALIYTGKFLFGNILFISSIMLIDLKNSPIDKKDQLFFGIFTSLCLVIFYILKLNYNITLSGYTFAQLAEIMAILLANVIFFFTHRLIEQPNVNKIQSN